MNERCSGIKKNGILEPEHPLCSSCSDVMSKIAAHTFSSKVISNNSHTILKLHSNHTQTIREPVSITTATTKNDFKTTLKDIRVTNLSYRYIPHQYKFYQK